MENQAENSNQVYKNQKYGQSRELFYNYDQDGNFSKTVGFHPEHDRVILQQAWDYFDERIEEARQKVSAGKASPIVYYMEKILTDPMGLSMMAGVPLWKLKLHCRPAFFKRLSMKTLGKYAEAFSISADELKNFK